MNMEDGAYMYILRCSDDSYYVGSARGSLERRVLEHQSGLIQGYTAARRPVVLVYAEHFPSITDAIAAERQVKGWRREKKEALILRDWSSLPALSRRRPKAGIAED